MADNYRQFSEAISNLTPDEAKWLESVLDGEETFRWEIEDDELWIHSDDSFNEVHLIAVVQAFLRKFRPNECFSVGYTETSSKPRVREFGGGAIFITANSVQHKHTDEWIASQEKKFLQSIERQKTIKSRKR